MLRLRDLSTRLKLLLFAGAFTALLLLTSLGGLRANDALRAMLRTQYERDTLGLYDAEEAARASMTMAKEMRNAVLDDADPPMVAEFTDKFRANDRNFAVRVDALEKHVVGDEVAKLAEVREKFAVYHDFTDKVFDAARHRQDAEARRYLHELRAPFGRFQVLLTEIAESKKRLGREAYDESERLVAVQRARTVAVDAAAIFAGLALALLIARSISKPLLETASILERVADGDLAGRSAIQSHDEIGRTAASLNHALDKLSVALRSVGERADTLTAASESLSSLGAQLGTSSEDSSAKSNSVAAAAGQASSNVHTVAASTEQMNVSAREIAKGTAEAAALARGGAEAAAEVHALVGDLARGSAEIEGVVKLISGIAGQTNLLALNATIEAARAGEAGKGFAVVADEVKELARASASATGEISERIAGIQSANARAIEAIAKVAGFMSRISEQQALMAAAVEEQVHTTSEMGRNVGEAARATEDIARSAVSVASAAESTSQGARAALRQATSLAGTATELRALMGQFKILPA